MRGVAMIARRRFSGALLGLAAQAHHSRSVVAALLASGSTLGSGQAQTALRPTPADALGPYYPVSWTGEIDADLVQLRGRAYAHGIPMLLSGQVLNTHGRPLAAAQVEIWQTDATGKYRHPGDDGEGPAQRGFQGYGRTSTDAGGRYEFRTIKPVIYGGRPPHVHFKVESPGYLTLVTQLYFEGENQERSLFGGFSRERDRLTIRPGRSQEAGREVLSARFDLVLAVA